MRAGAGAGRVPRDRASGVSPPQDQSLGNWRIKRQILEGEEIAYKFTPKYVLRAGQTVTVGGCRQGLGCWGAGELGCCGAHSSGAAACCHVVCPHCPTEPSPELSGAPA